MPADKSVNDGIDFLQSHKLYISRDSENMVKEIQGYVWKEDKDGNVLDIPVKFKDHTCDSARYGIYTHWKLPVDNSILVYKGKIF